MQLPSGALGTMFMLWFKFTCGTIWYFRLFWCMVVYSDVFETKEYTKGDIEPQSLLCNFLHSRMVQNPQIHLAGQQIASCNIQNIEKAKFLLLFFTVLHSFAISQGAICITVFFLFVSYSISVIVVLFP